MGPPVRAFPEQNLNGLHSGVQGFPKSVAKTLRMEGPPPPAAARDMGDSPCCSLLAGNPKGVMITHANACAATAGLLDAGRYNEQVHARAKGLSEKRACVTNGSKHMGCVILSGERERRCRIRPSLSPSPCGSLSSVAVLPCPAPPQGDRHSQPRPQGNLLTDRIHWLSPPPVAACSRVSINNPLLVA